MADSSFNNGSCHYEGTGLVGPVLIFSLFPAKKIDNIKTTSLRDGSSLFLAVLLIQFFDFCYNVLDLFLGIRVF